MWISLANAQRTPERSSLHIEARTAKYTKRKLERIQEEDEAYSENTKRRVQERYRTMGVLLDGLTKLINSNTQNMPSLVNSIKDAFKKDPVAFDISATEHTVNNVTKLTKPAKVPSWTKDTSLETYSKQIAMWTGKNEDVPEYVKYHDLMEELKKNKDI